MRVTPTTPLHRCAMTAGAVFAAGVLLAGCSDDGGLGDLFDFGDSEETLEGAQEQAEEALDEAQEDAEEALDGVTDGEDEDSEDQDAEGEESEEDADADAEAAEEGDGDDDDGWWDTIVSWFSSDDEDEDTDHEDTDDEDAEDEGPSYGLPADCTEAGAAEAGGEFVPFGAQVQEESGELDGIPDSAYLICAWETEQESFTIIYTENADPSSLVDLSGGTGEQEMNWEVDVDVDVENYRSTEADELGGDMDYSSTVDGSTQIIHLSLPDDFYIAAVSIGQDAEQQDLERVVYDAADRL